MRQLLTLFVLALFIGSFGVFAQTQPVKIESSEVMLDIVARDKKGNLIKDLKLEEIELTEDGVKPTITRFRYAEGTVPTNKNEVGNVSATSAPTFDPTRQMRLVTMVFDTLGSIDSRRLAQQAALDFLDTQMQPNTLVAVYKTDRRAYAVCEFSNDHAKLKDAILRITGGNFTQYEQLSGGIRTELETYLRSSEAQRRITGTAANAAPDSGAIVQAKQAQIMLNMMTLADSAQRDMLGRASISSLLALVRGLKSLQARKTMLYFAEGIRMSADLKDLFDLLRSEANRANVSIYTVDTRGLNSAGNGAGLLNQAVVTSQAMMTSGADNLGFGNEQLAMDATVADSQVLMRDLAETTGGFLIANTNDARKQLQKVVAEVSSYYELFYSPPNTSYDGRFRKILVKTTRPGVTLQTRNGYFAVPPTGSGAPVMGYEMPMLAALNATPKPHSFDYKVGKLRFAATAEGVHTRIVLEAAANNFTFVEDAAKKTYKARFSVLAVIKDADNQIVQKLSQTFPLTGTSERLPVIKTVNAIFFRDVTIAPGRYTLETAWLDHETMKVSAASEPFFVPDLKGDVKLSSLVVIKKTEALKPEDNRDDTLTAQGQRITPFIGEVELSKANARLPLYFQVYSAPANKALVKAELRFLQDGNLIGTSPLELPAPDAQGRVTQVVTLPLDSLNPGKYELRIVVQQGTAVAQERLSFTMK